MFLYIARGSLAETEYFLHLSHQLGYLSDAEFSALSEMKNRAFAALQGLIDSVKKEASVVARLIACFSSTVVLYGIKTLS